MSDAARETGRANGTAPETPPALPLPYADFSHALVRAHHDAFAMAAANRKLADSLRAVVRRQQDLAFELAEAAFGGKGGAANPTALFDRAAQAVREVGEALIDAQIEALRMMQSEADAERPTFAFPAMTGEVAKSHAEASPIAKAL